MRPGISTEGYVRPLVRWSVTEFREIKTMPRPEWNRKVRIAIESKNKERLIDSCHKQEGENRIIKRKTASIIPIISNSTYKREPQINILRTSKRETKTITMARYGVLECGYNYKGTMKETCDLCNCIDDENHRLNFCKKWKNLNLSESVEKLDYNLIYSDNLMDIRHVTNVLENVWNTHNANGTIRTE